MFILPPLIRKNRKKGSIKTNGSRYSDVNSQRMTYSLADAKYSHADEYSYVYIND